MDYVLPVLNIDKLKKEAKDPLKIKFEVYKNILVKCHNKIEYINKYTHNRNCVYEIPILNGFPIYDLKEINDFLLFNLRANGLYAKAVDDKRIYISWKNDMVNEDQYKRLITHLESLKEKDKEIKIDDNKIEDVDVDDIIKKQKKNKKNKKEDEKLVTLIKYNDNLEDYIPVNTHKMKDLFEKPKAIKNNNIFSDPYNQINRNSNIIKEKGNLYKIY